METKYIPDAEFNEYVRSRTWRIEDIEGHNRWIITEDGVDYICRPESTKS